MVFFGGGMWEFGGGFGFGEGEGKEGMDMGGDLKAHVDFFG